MLQRAREVLSGQGILVINSVAGPELEFTRRELATLGAVFDHVGMIIQGSVLHGARFGNATLIASMAPIDTEAMREQLAGDASKGVLLTDLAEIIDGPAPVSDADQLWSPKPDLPDYSGAVKILEQAKAMLEDLRDVQRGADPQRHD